MNDIMNNSPIQLNKKTKHNFSVVQSFSNPNSDYTNINVFKPIKDNQTKQKQTIF